MCLNHIHIAWCSVSATKQWQLLSKIMCDIQSITSLCNSDKNVKKHDSGDWLTNYHSWSMAILIHLTGPAMIITIALCLQKYTHGLCLLVFLSWIDNHLFWSYFLASLALWRSYSRAKEATLLNMGKCMTSIPNNHIKTKHSKTTCILYGIYYCSCFTFLNFSQ